MAISDLHDEAVMARAAIEQAIFVFVEGDSEELALPLLFTDILDLEAVGARIANYNGHGNLRAALRLLKATLTHDRPIFDRGVELDDQHAVLEGRGHTMRHIKVRSMKDLKDKHVEWYIEQSFLLKEEEA